MIQAFVNKTLVKECHTAREAVDILRPFRSNAPYDRSTKLFIRDIKSMKIHVILPPLKKDRKEWGKRDKGHPTVPVEEPKK